MTISSVVPVNNYTGNSSATTFDFDFLIENGSELVVTKTDSSGNIITLVENTDYSIHETGNTSGSYITFPLSSSSHSILTSDEVLTLALDLEIKQESSFPTDIKLSLPVIERTFDYVVRLIQILSRKLERAVKVKESPNIDTEVLVNNIDKISSNLSVLTDINDDISNINAVSENKANIDTVALISSDVVAVAEICEKVSAVSDNETNINSVAADIGNVNTVAGNISSVNGVYQISSEVSSVADNSSAVTTCANNITAINSAPVHAQNAENKANAANSSAISANSFALLAKNWAVKTDGTVDGTDYSSKYYALRSRDISGVVYKELNSNIGYKREDILDDARLYSHVSSYNHSTFDLSKFSVVGAPTINDGIASGFSSSNYITKTITDLDYSKDFDFISPAATLASNTSQKYFIIDATGGFRISQHVAQVKFSFKLNGDTSLTEYTVLNNLQIGDTVQGRIKKVGTDLYLYVRKNNGDWIGYTNNPVTNVLTLNANNVIDFGWSGAGDNYCWDGLIDLKQLSIAVNGYPVFSGTKTGIDTIKPDDYTVVGAPAISADGVATNFPYNGFVNKSGLNLDISRELTFYGSFIVGSKTNVGRTFLEIRGDKSIRFTLTDSNNLNIATTSQTGLQTLVYGQEYDYKITFKENIWRVYIKENNDWSQELIINNDPLVSLTSNITDIVIGANTSFLQENNNRKWTGSLDLNSFKVYVDGDLIYQPCLKIPYSESSTGSKVVDAAYRSRVQDIYEQYGNALYYTIDVNNKNVTLPMGEIYGFIEENKENISTNTSEIATKQTIGDWCITLPTTTSTASLDKPATVIANYLLNTQGAVKFSDGLIIQWGYFMPINNTDNRVSLPVPFSSNKYNVHVRINNQNTSMNINSGYLFPNRTTTYFDMQTVGVNYPFDWFAIGY